MNFIQIAYCLTVPFLLFMSLFGSEKRKNTCINLLSVSNLLLIGYSFFLVRQIIGLYQLGRQFNIEFSSMTKPFGTGSLGLVLLILFPLFSLISSLRKNKYFSIILLILLYCNSSLLTLSGSGILQNILMYFCLFISGYSLLWLLHKLPYQSIKE